MQGLGSRARAEREQIKNRAIGAGQEWGMSEAGAGKEKEQDRGRRRAGAGRSRSRIEEGAKAGKE